MIYVQEKLDGSCVSVARMNGEIYPLIRAGYLALSSKYEQHHFFHGWAMQNRSRFLSLLKDGERACGEWLLQAHGTRYKLPHEPFVIFDIMTRHERKLVSEVEAESVWLGFITPRLIHAGDAISIADVVKQLEPSGHGAIDPVEGAVWRCERNGKVDFLGKYVRPEKEDGKYLESICGEIIYNIEPKEILK